MMQQDRTRTGPSSGKSPASGTTDEPGALIGRCARRNTSRKLEQSARETEYVEHFAHEHIDPEADRERKQASEVADNFDGQHDGSTWPAPGPENAFRGRAGRVSRCQSSCNKETRRLRKPRGTDTSAVGDSRVGTRLMRLLSKHKNADAAEHGDILIRVVADVVFEQVADADAHGVREQALPCTAEFRRVGRRRCGPLSHRKKMAAMRKASTSIATCVGIGYAGFSGWM